MLSGIFTLWRYASPAARQMVFLLGVDSFANVVDYGFHVYLGRALVPRDFATVQTINAALLILITAFGAVQPVMARFVAEAEARKELASTNRNPPSRVIFQGFFRSSALVGVLFAGFVWLGRYALAEWLNVPPQAVAVSAVMVLLALLRPVVAGMLQGQQRFVAFGSTRAIHAMGRLVTAVVLIGLGAGLLGALAAFPVGAMLALVGGLVFLGTAVWRPGASFPRHFLYDGFRLSVGAFIAYAAYMSLLNSDLIWVNRTFAAETAGSYATLVLLRRVVALTPGAVMVVMYPRLVNSVARGQPPDELLWKAAVVVSGSTLVLTVLYFAFGPTIVGLAFGEVYVEAAPLLGWMGVAMLGYGIGAIWLNLSLATRLLPFVVLLAITAVLQYLLLALFHETIVWVTAIFLLGGWLLAVGGLLIYLVVLRPNLVQQSEDR
jgi:O-antigen/teichoic acid export membrane protein